MSIRWRLTLWYGLSLIIMLLALAAGTYFGGAVLLKANADRQLRSTAKLLADAVQHGEEPAVVGTVYRVLSLNGQIQYASGLPARLVPVAPAALLAARRGQAYQESLAVDPAALTAQNAARWAGLELRLLTVPVGNPPQAILQVGQVIRDATGFRALLLGVLAGILGLGVPLAALGGWWLAGRALAPIHTMAAAARRIEAANLAERLPQPVRMDELGGLAATINQLLDRLQAAFQRERRFTTDVSHDLRTPLALIKSSVGVALNRPRANAELLDTLKEVDQQVDRMAALLDAILFLSRADSDQPSDRRLPLNLSELLADLHETAAAYAHEERDQEIACDIPLHLWVLGDKDQLTRLFMNLLDNALAYTPRGGSIRLAATAAPGAISIEVEDNGAGIAPDDLPHVFERFFRADRARGGGEHRHHGLGLSIAQAIAHAHGGEITVTSTPGRGSCFRVRIAAISEPGLKT